MFTFAELVKSAYPNFPDDFDLADFADAEDVCKDSQSPLTIDQFEQLGRGLASEGAKRAVAVTVRLVKRAAIQLRNWFGDSDDPVEALIPGDTLRKARNLIAELLPTNRQKPNAKLSVEERVAKILGYSLADLQKGASQRIIHLLKTKETELLEQEKAVEKQRFEDLRRHDDAQLKKLERRLNAMEEILATEMSMKRKITVRAQVTHLRSRIKDISSRNQSAEHNPFRPPAQDPILLRDEYSKPANEAHLLTNLTHLFGIIVDIVEARAKQGEPDDYLQALGVALGTADHEVIRNILRLDDFEDIPLKAVSRGKAIGDAAAPMTDLVGKLFLQCFEQVQTARTLQTDFEETWPQRIRDKHMALPQKSADAGLRNSTIIIDMKLVEQHDVVKCDRFVLREVGINIHQRLCVLFETALTFSQFH